MRTGKDLFGVDKRWAGAIENLGKGRSSGALPVQFPSLARVGDWGFFAKISFTVIQKTGTKSLLVYIGDKKDDVLLLHGLDCSKVVDGDRFILQLPFVVPRTYTYTTVSGAAKTVILVECDQQAVAKAFASHAEKTLAETRKREEALAKARQEEAARRKAIEDAKWRTWTSADGKHRLDGKFVGCVGGMLRLEKKDGTTLDVKLASLCSEDQEFVQQRKWMDPASLAVRSPKAPPSTSVSKKASKPKHKESDKDPRSRWLNTSYNSVIYHVEGKQWAEMANATRKVKWHLTETARTPEYIELVNDKRKDVTRLFPNRMDVRAGDNWKWVSKGHWDPSSGQATRPW